MPREMQEMIGRKTVHRDSRQPSGHLTIARSVEITDLCPMRRPPQLVRLDYAPGAEGLYVEVADHRVDAGYAHREIFLVSKLAELAAPRPNGAAFHDLAARLGLYPQRFLKIILDHAPPEPR